MKHIYIRILSVLSVVVVLAVVFCFSVSARQVEGAQVGGNGVVSGNPIYDNNDGYVFDESVYLLNDNNFILTLNNYPMSHAVSFVNNPLFSVSSPYYVTEYVYGGYYGTPSNNALFTLDVPQPVLGIAKGKANYSQRYTLAFGTNYKLPSLFGPLRAGQIRLNLVLLCQDVTYDSSGTASLGETFFHTLNFTTGEIYGVDLLTEGFFTGDIIRDTDFVIKGLTITTTVDMTDTEAFEAGFGYFYLGNFIIEDVSPTYADSPSYKNPNNSGFNDSVDVENNFNDVLDDSVNEFDDIIIDTENLIIADGLYGEFSLVKDFLGRIFAIDIIYKLSMVAICFGLLTFLINLGVRVLNSRRKDGD